MAHITENIRQYVWILLALCTSTLQSETLTIGQRTSQTIEDEIKAEPERSAGIIYSLPTGERHTDTPAPDGKKPFYISHFGCSASYYLESQKQYTNPIATLAKADSLNMLTPLGQDVLHRLKLICEDAKQRVGELTIAGTKLIQELAQDMVDRFPDMFVKDSYIDARSIVRNHNIMTMQEATTQISRHCPTMDVRIKSSHSNDAWMMVRDMELEADRFNTETETCYEAFIKANRDNQRLMESLFVSADYVKTNIDANELSDQLFMVACTIQNTPLKGIVTLYDIFTPQEIFQHWRINNAKYYISYGAFEQNGGNQPFSQRAPLRNLLHQGDSIKKLDFPVVHLRFSSRGMVMALICLMELDNFGLKTSDLYELEKQGWADYRIAPFGSSVQVIYYRKDKNDDDILIKVLLNGQESRLPVKTDCAPYYNWQEVKRYYLRKLYAHEKLRFNKKNMNEESN
jgi:hypothetical protein